MIPCQMEQFPCHHHCGECCAKTGLGPTHYDPLRVPLVPLPSILLVYSFESCRSLHTSPKQQFPGACSCGGPRTTYRGRAVRRQHTGLHYNYGCNLDRDIYLKLAGFGTTFADQQQEENNTHKQHNAHERERERDSLSGIHPESR